MKNQPLLIVCLISLLLCLYSCGMNEKDDWEIFNQFEPLEWSDDYVFSSTNNPYSILVWDGKSGKLVHTYSLLREDINRNLDIEYMKVSGHSVWIIAVGKTRNLIQLDVDTGKMNYKHTGFKLGLYGLASVQKEEDGKGTLWVNSCGYPYKGMEFACFDYDGNMLENFTVVHEDIAYSEINVSYIDGTYYMAASKFNDFFNQKGEQKGFTLINLSEKTTEDISYSTIFPENFLNQELSMPENERFISSLIIHNAGDKYILLVTCANSLHDISYRMLYEVKSFSPFAIEYLNIKKNNKRFFSIQSKNGKIYATGRPIYDDFNGLEVAVYDENGGEEERVIRLPDGNQNYCHITEDATWFSKDTWGYIYDSQGAISDWDRKGCPEIYKLIHSTGNIYKYSEDGTQVLIK